MSKDGSFHASAWHSEVADALDVADGTSTNFGAKDGVFQVDVAVPGACMGGSCYDGLPTLTVDGGPIASWGFFNCLWTMGDP